MPVPSANVRLHVCKCKMCVVDGKTLVLAYADTEGRIHAHTLPQRSLSTTMGADTNVLAVREPLVGLMSVWCPKRQRDLLVLATSAAVWGYNCHSRLKTQV